MTLPGNPTSKNQRYRRTAQIFTKAQNKTQDPAKLYRLIDRVDSTRWVMPKPRCCINILASVSHQAKCLICF